MVIIRMCIIRNCLEYCCCLLGFFFFYLSKYVPKDFPIFLFKTKKKTKQKQQKKNNNNKGNNYVEEWV